MEENEQQHRASNSQSNTSVPSNIAPKSMAVLEPVISRVPARNCTQETMVPTQYVLGFKNYQCSNYEWLSLYTKACTRGNHKKRATARRKYHTGTCNHVDSQRNALTARYKVDDILLTIFCVNTPKYKRTKRDIYSYHMQMAEKLLPKEALLHVFAKSPFWHFDWFLFGTTKLVVIGKNRF